MAWPTGWTKFDTIILPAIAALSAPLADVPYVITNLPATVYAGARSDGGDLRCSISDGSVEIPLQVVSFDTGAQTCELHLLAPMVSPGSTNTVRIYYGAASETMPAADSTYGSQAVWAAGSNADYTGVYHLNEAVNTGAGGYKDSTTNANHMTGVSMAMTAPAGKIGTGAEFDGTADYLYSNTLPISAYPFTFSAWAYVDNVTANHGVVGVGNSGSFSHQQLSIRGSDANDPVASRSRDDSGSPTNATAVYNGATAGTWLHVAACNATAASRRAFLNGVSGTEETTSILYATMSIFTVGSIRVTEGFLYPLDGKIDEVRISASARSADWLYAEYYMGANQSAPTYGGEQSIGGGVVAKIFQQMAA